MKSRILLTTLIVVLLLGVMPVIAQEPVTVTISTWAGVDEAAELQVILDGINEGNDVFQVVHEPIPADYYTQVQTNIAAGAGADMYWIDQDNMSLAAEGVFLPLTDCLADAEEGSVGDVNDYHPGIMQIARFDDVAYGLPWIAAPVVTFYNRDMFDAAGLDYPSDDWTWDDFMEMGAALTQDTDGDGELDQWGFTRTGWPPPHPFIWQAGGVMISEDFTESPIDSPEVLEGLEFYLNMTEIIPDRDTIAEQGFSEMFKFGVVAMFMGGAADDLDRIEGLNVGVVRLPGHPETGSHQTFAWTAATAVSAGTEHPEEACAALLAVTEGIHNWKVMSPRVSQTTIEHLVASEPRKEASAEPIVLAAEDMRAFRIFPRFREWNSVQWDDFLNPIINGETDLTPAELAAEVRPDLEEFFGD